MSSRKLAIEYLPVASLRPDPKNARLHSDKQVQQIARSIEAFGFNVPVLVDANSQVMAGHGRLLACKLLDIAQVPVIRLEHLSQPQMRAFMIADNRLTENSEWDNRLLGEQLKILSEAELDFSLEVTGFEMGEIDLVIENFSPASEGADDPADTLPEPSSVQVSRVGDLWQLGKHRVLCGDALSPDSYKSLMGDYRAHVVFADPPYNDPIDGYVTGFGKVHHPEFAMASGEMSEPEFTDFLTNVLAQLARNSVDGALQFICMDWRHSGELILAARSVYSEFKNLCVWVKDNAGQGSLYRSQHELVFVFKNGRSPHRNNIQLGQYGRYRSNVWQYRRVNSLSRSTDEGNLCNLHPTIKPVELVADAILDCTARGDVVLDAFLGSGTTVIAAERTGRTCYGVELDPRYVDTIVRRWQAFTGQFAVQGSTGRTFIDIEEESCGRARSAGEAEV
ncbi:MAG: DNA methyltransferase [Candidatus Acidiferrales bacterium]